jgi:beta-phosphoglucomutase family hydrolase
VPKQADAVVVEADRFDAVIFDMDGVITDTARTHRAAWGRAFDALLEHSPGYPRPFSGDDYLRHVDGRARVDGATRFLSSRGITLPEGSSDDDPGLDTTWAVANLKDEHFRRALADEGAHPFPTSLDLVAAVRDAGLGTAIVTASRNRREVLAAAGATGLFDVAVDGVTAVELSLPGKPDPALFLEAARQLGVEPSRAVVVEDALSGVEAGREGGFGLVIGVARGGEADRFRDHGAHVVVADLGEIDLRRAEP